MRNHDQVGCVSSEISQFLHDRRVRFLFGGPEGAVLFVLWDSCRKNLNDWDIPKSHAKFEISRRMRIQDGQDSHVSEPGLKTRDGFETRRWFCFAPKPPLSVLFLVHFFHSHPFIFIILYCAFWLYIFGSASFDHYSLLICVRLTQRERQREMASTAGKVIKCKGLFSDKLLI